MRGQRRRLGAAKTFHTDGTPLIFSTLRPDPQTNVRLWTLEHWTLDAWIFAVVLLGGGVLVLVAWRGACSPWPRSWSPWCCWASSGPLVDAHLGRADVAAVAIVLLFWAVVGLFRLYQPLMTFAAAIGTTWSTWVASRKVMVAAAGDQAARPVVRARRRCKPWLS